MKIVFKGHHQSGQSQALKLLITICTCSYNSPCPSPFFVNIFLSLSLTLGFPAINRHVFQQEQKQFWLRGESNSPWVRQGQELTTDKKKSRKSHCCLRKMLVAFGRTLPKVARCLPRPNTLIIPIRQPGSQRNANLNNCQERYQSSSVKMSLFFSVIKLE